MAIHRYRKLQARVGRRLGRLALVGFAVSLGTFGLSALRDECARREWKNGPQRSGIASRDPARDDPGQREGAYAVPLHAGQGAAGARAPGSCAKYWPPAIAPAKPAGGTGVKAALLGTTLRRDGRRQLTYNHHPLYGFALDKQPGQTNGQGSTAFGGQWWAVSSKGRPVKKRARSSGPDDHLDLGLDDHDDGVDDDLLALSLGRSAGCCQPGQLKVSAADADPGQMRFVASRPGKLLILASLCLGAGFAAHAGAVARPATHIEVVERDFRISAPKQVAEWRRRLDGREQGARRP